MAAAGDPDDAASFLVVILDVDPVAWAARGDDVEDNPNALTLRSCSEQLVFFLNAMLLLQRSNRVAVIATHPAENRILFPPPSKKPAPVRLSEVDQAVIKGIQQVAVLPLPQASTSNGSLLAGALSQALCMVARAIREDAKMLARILVVTASNDVAQLYIPMMNCIFSSQKQGVPVDSCVLSKTPSLFLQQAAYLTQGVYLHVPAPQGGNLLEYLLMSFLPDHANRKVLLLPQLQAVDFRATCFCHKKVIDTGVVCQVCLSIFCEPGLSCKTCSTRYPVITASGAAARRPAGAAGGAAATPAPVLAPTAAAAPPAAAAATTAAAETGAEATGSTAMSL